MTIAVGVLASDGIVLAADTQLTITNFWKGEGGKIMAVARKQRDRVTGACAVTGATAATEPRMTFQHLSIPTETMAGYDESERTAEGVRWIPTRTRREWR